MREHPQIRSQEVKNLILLLVIAIALFVATRDVLSCDCYTWPNSDCNRSNDCGCDPPGFGDCTGNRKFIPGSVAHECGYREGANDILEQICVWQGKVLCFRFQLCKGSGSVTDLHICEDSKNCVFFVFYICLPCTTTGLSVPVEKDTYACEDL